MEKTPQLILKTKFHRPPVTPDLAQRNHLLNVLQQDKRPLTLISAPAGYGKTTLASMWLETCGRRSAWISLDEDENDMFLFLSYLVTAISGVFSDLSFQTQNLLAAAKLPSLPTLVKTFANDLEQIDETLILVLDDLHYIHNRDVYEFLDTILKHPPRNLQLVLISRHDPPLQIDLLRARGLVTEIRILDLRFTAQETALLMEKLLNREVTPEIATNWAEMTDGWVTAIRLAILSISHRGQNHNLDLIVRGDNHYLRTYLLSEVLSPLPHDYRNYLVKIALLDHFCASLCEAVYLTGEEDHEVKHTGKSFLQWLQSENLFLIPLDDENEWFRFHHLFQEMLQNTLRSTVNEEEIASLYMRASQWCAENGLIDDALVYALKAGNIQAAVDLVLQYRYDLMNYEQWNRLDLWLKLLPEQIVSQHPLLLTARLHIYSFRSQIELVYETISNIQQLLTDLSHDPVTRETAQCELTTYIAISNVVTLQSVQESVDLAQYNLKRLSEQALYLKAQTHATNTIGLQMLGDLKQGENWIRNALAENTWPETLQARLMLNLCITFFLEGDLEKAINSARISLRISEKVLALETLSMSRYYIGVIHYLRDDFGQAEQYLFTLFKNRDTSHLTYMLHGSFVLTLIYLSQGRKVEAAQVFKTLESYLQETDHQFGLNYIRDFYVELAIRNKDLVKAKRLSKIANLDIASIWFYFVPPLTPIKMLLAEGTAESLQEANNRLDALEKPIKHYHRNCALIDLLALKTLVLSAQGDEIAALENLKAALTLGIQGGFIRSFVDLGAPMAALLNRLRKQPSERQFVRYIDQIQMAFPDSQQIRASAAQAQLIEPLTGRELEVLALLAKRYSNNEIAAQLVISPRTVKRHTLNIYQKLEVNSRHQAVERGTALGILV